MQIHPLVPIKKAASLLGVEKEVLRDKLASGEIKGEQRRVGSKDKWFVYSGEVSNRIDTERLPQLMRQTDGHLALDVEPLPDPVSLEDLNKFFELDENSATEEIDENGAIITSLNNVFTAAGEVVASPGDVVTSTARVLEGVPKPNPKVSSPLPASIATVPSVSELNAQFTPASTNAQASIATSISDMDYIFESLTTTFAQRLSDEYQKVLIADQRAKAAEQKLEMLEILEIERDDALVTVEERDSTIAALVIQAAELEAQVKALEIELDAKKMSWWEKWFTSSKP